MRSPKTRVRTADVGSAASAVRRAQRGFAELDNPRLLRSDADLFPGILDDFISRVRRIHSHTVIVPNEHDTKSPLLQHSRELPLTVANRKCGNPSSGCNTIHVREATVLFDTRDLKEARALLDELAA